MRNYKITKRIFFLTIFLLLVNLIVFSLDRLLGSVVFGNGVVFYLPMVILVTSFDRFYFKNKTPYFIAILLLSIISLFVLYILSQSYFDSVFL
jgi:hypothetical protein